MATRDFEQETESGNVFIEDILKMHEPVLIDTSAINSGDLLTHILMHKSYEALDYELMNIELKAQELFLGIMSHKNILTIPEVTEEFFKIIEKLHGTKRYIDRRCNLIRDNISGTKSELIRNRETLETIISNFKTMHSLCSESELRIQNDPIYKTLVEIVKASQEVLQIKERTELKYGRCDRLKNNDTDERLVAAFYWILLNPDSIGISPAIISNDWDILHLIGATSHSFLNYHLEPYNKIIKDVLLRGNFSVYIGNVEYIGWTRKYGLESAIEKVRKKYNPEKREELIKKLNSLFEKLNGNYKALK